MRPADLRGAVHLIRPAWSRAAFSTALGTALCLTFVACGPSDRTPEGAVRQLLYASASGNAPRVYALLAPSTRKRLQELATTATAQTGGSHRITPEELLAVSIDRPRHDPARIEVVSDRDDRARVRLVARNKRATETLDLVRVDGHWRVLLPDSAFTPPDEQRD